MATTSKLTIARDPLRTDILLADAERQLEAGDGIHASLNLWRVAEQGLKTIAGARGWRCASKADAYVVAGHVANLFGDSEVLGLVVEMSGYGQNFYDESTPVEDLWLGLKGARELVRLLREAHDAIPLDAPGPTEPHYVQRAAEAAAQRSA